MPSQNPPDPDARELSFQVRTLTGAVERLAEQVENNFKLSQSNREEILVIKTRSGIVWGCFSVAGGAIAALVLKLVFKI